MLGLQVNLKMRNYRTKKHKIAELIATLEEKNLLLIFFSFVIILARKKAKIEATLDKQSDLREKLTVKLKPGRPRLEESQPVLLKTIMNLTRCSVPKHINSE